MTISSQLTGVLAVADGRRRFEALHDIGLEQASDLIQETAFAS
jgi:hypothetical protein